jgi:hypothetical protein
MNFFLSLSLILGAITLFLHPLWIVGASILFFLIRYGTSQVSRLA